jgi:NlpC/P60 family
MSLLKAPFSTFRVNFSLKNTFRPYRFLAFSFAVSVMQFVQPSTAFCEPAFSENTAIPQTKQIAEPHRQTLGHMGSFFSDVTHYFGTRYRFGGQTPAGFDCSGFVRFMFDKAFNMHLPRSSREMSAIGNKVEKNDLQPGDLVFFQTKGQHINHVGIFIGNDTFIHSSLSKGITEDRLKQGYFDKRFAGAVRLLEVPSEKLSIPSTKPDASADNTEPS